MVQRSRYFVAAALILLNTSICLGASVAVAPQGNGIFVIQGTDMNGVAGLEFSVTYDTATLSSPSVSQGSLISGALMVANTKIPGTIKIAVISNIPFTGNGPIATISFGTHSGKGMVSVSVSMIDTKGGTLPGGTSNATDPDTVTAGNPSTSSTVDDVVSNPTAPPPPGITPDPDAKSGSTYLGTVNMPADNQPQPENKNLENMTDTAPAGAPPAEETAAVSVPPAEKELDTAATTKKGDTFYQSVIDRFRTYQGDRTQAGLLALFAEAVAPGIRQAPAIATSDGTPVIVTLELAASAGNSPNFALSGAKMLSLKREEGNEKWILEVLPQTNTFKATITILSDNTMIEFPLTIVPPIGIKPSDIDFIAFLKDTGAKPPKFDLNKDGRHDYLDDYLYTGHYLKRTNIPKPPK